MLWAALNTGGLDHIDLRQTAKWNAFTAPWPTNGPTPGSTAATPNAASNSRSGYTPTITAATPHSAANHPPAAYLTCQVSTASAPSSVHLRRRLCAHGGKFASLSIGQCNIRRLFGLGVRLAVGRGCRG